MSTAQPTDPRREYLRRQAIARRQRVLERISAVRLLVVGGVVSATCVLVGYIDANAHTRSHAATGSSLGTAGSGSVAAGGSAASSQSLPGGGSAASSQSLLGGGSAPSAASGGGTVISGGS